MKNIVLKDNTTNEELYPVTSAGLVSYNETNVEQALATKQDTLVSGTNIKTINNQSLLGPGNISISSGEGGTSTWDEITGKPQNLVTNVTISGSGNAVTDASFASGTLTFTKGDISTSSGLTPEQEDKLDSIAEGATKVSFQRTLSEGVNIGTITINDVPTVIYAPTSEGATVDTNTTYTFTNGNGSFTVTPSEGEPQVVSIGKPSTAGSADTLVGLTVNVTDLNSITEKSTVSVTGELSNANALDLATITVDEEDHVIKVPLAGTASRIAGLWQPSTPSSQPRVSGQLVYYAITSGNTTSAISATGEAAACITVATTSRPGVIKVGNGLQITADGTLSTTGSGGTEYTLPTATDAILGGIKTGWSGSAGQGYPIDVTSSGQAYLPVDLIAVQNASAINSGNDIVFRLNRPASGSIASGQACQWTIPANVLKTAVENSGFTSGITQDDADDRYLQQTEADTRYLRKDIDDITTHTLTAQTFYESSDRNLKENIVDIQNDKKILGSCVQFRQFNFKGSSDRKYGVIAQEVETAGLNELVSLDSNGNRAVDYISLLCLKVATLEEKIKELRVELQNLKSTH